MLRVLTLFVLLISPVVVMAQRGQGPQRGQGRGSSAEVWKALADKYDADKDNRVTVEEYPRGREKFESLDRNGDGVVSEEDFQMPAGRRGPRQPSQTPQSGDAAPDFELPRAEDETKTVRLSSFAGKRPVALVFGSYT
jgi:hypothetical protein